MIIDQRLKRAFEQKPFSIGLGLRNQFSKLELTSAETGAFLLFGTFVLATYFLHGALAITLVTICFLTAWTVIVLDLREGTLPMIRLGWPALLFFGFATIRLAIPPYGDINAVPGTAVTRMLLIAGLYGLVLVCYARIEFKKILWILSIAAFCSTAIALAWHAHQHSFADRLHFIGRSSNEILGAGGLVAGLAASIALLAHGVQKWLRAALAVMVVIELLAVYLSGSRGPMIALLLALAAAALLARRDSWKALYAAGLLAWTIVTLFVLLEGPIREWFCPVIALACRVSQRHDVWNASLTLITEHPLLGVGYGFRFPAVPHAHNGYVGLALHYGVLVLISFLVFLATCARDTMGLRVPTEKLYVIIMFVFANGFMGSDLSDPLRFFNTHYLFLWLPIFLAMVGKKSSLARAIESRQGANE
ncbi:MAG TPA: O-antigen ligase family protein [Methyloceanibacter sp.]